MFPPIGYSDWFWGGQVSELVQTTFFLKMLMGELYWLLPAGCKKVSYPRNLWLTILEMQGEPALQRRQCTNETGASCFLIEFAYHSKICTVLYTINIRDYHRF